MQAVIFDLQLSSQAGGDNAAADALLACYELILAAAARRAAKAFTEQAGGVAQVAQPESVEAGQS